MTSVGRVSLVAALVIAAFTALGIVLPTPGDDEMRFLEDDHDRHVYYQRGSFAPRGEVPFLEVHSEYPELATWFFALPFLAMGDAPADPRLYDSARPEDLERARPLFDRYVRLHSIAMAVCLFLLVVVSARICGLLGFDPARAWLLILPSSLIFTVARYDALPVLLVSVSLWLLLTKRFLLAIFVLSCAVLTKWYAILFLPFYLRYGRASLGRSVLAGLAVSAATAAAIVGTTFVSGGLRYAEIATAPGARAAIATLPAAELPRALERVVESLPEDFRPFATGGLRAALSPYLKQGGRTSNPGGLYQQISQRWTRIPSGSPTEQSILRALTLLQFAFLFVGIFAPQRDPAQLVRWMCLATAFFVLFAKFYSPQWVMWTNALVLLFMRHRMLIATAVLLDLFIYFQFSIVRGTSLRGTRNADGTWALSDFWYHLYDVRIALTALFTLLVALSLFVHRDRGEGAKANLPAPA